MKRNLVVAVIIIVLFVVLAAIGYTIYAIQNRVKLFGRKTISEEDEE